MTKFAGEYVFTERYRKLVRQILSYYHELVELEEARKKSGSPITSDDYLEMLDVYGIKAGCVIKRRNNVIPFPTAKARRLRRKAGGLA